MNYLYLITEDDSDTLFFEGCLEKLTGLNFQVDETRLRLRKGGGVSNARQMLRQVLQEIRYSGTLDNAYLVVAIDNDRAPAHPGHKRLDGLSKSDQSKGCRVCELHGMLESELGPEQSQWPISIAIAVPVEMIESWLLLICNHEPHALPIFGSKSKKSTQSYFLPKPPPDQLKDLCAIEIQKSSKLSMAEFCLDCATELLDPDDLAQKPPSFAHFKAQVETWK